MLKLLAATATMAISFVSAAPIEDQVYSIPGYPAFDNFGMYSGYVELSGTSKRIHYLFVESQRDKMNDPVLIWYNGGPGCSSMLAWAQEHGPFLQSDTSLNFTKNEHSWNKELNVLYIEQPAGVGYSYCDKDNRPQDCNHTDNTMAHDNL